MTVNSRLKLDSIFFNLKSIECNSWKIFYYREFENIIGLENIQEDIWQELNQYIKRPLSSNFRIQLHLRSVPFLVAFFYKEKEIRIATSKLSSELFVLQQSSILELRVPAVTNLRIHTEKIASLSFKNFPTVIETITTVGCLPNFLEENFIENDQAKKLSIVEEKAQEITKQLLVNLNSYAPTLFENITDYGLGLTAQFALLRIHLLKFLAILPSLDHDKNGSEVKRILLEALSRFIQDNKKSADAKKKGNERSLPKRLSFFIIIGYYCAYLTPAKLLTSLVRKSVKLMARRFIAGESIETADKSLKSLFDTKRDVTLDQLGELVVSEREADHYCNEVLKLVKGFSLHVHKGELNSAGINRAHVSIKVSALCSDFKPHAEDYTYQLVTPRLKKILLAAKEEDVFINIDAEHYHYRDIVFKIYKRLLLETPELKDYKSTGIVVQAYLRDAYKHLAEIIELAKVRNICMPVRLVKGAYWDAETVEGTAHSFNAPQFLNKEETDIHFRQLIYKIYEAHPHLKLCIASHNFSDHAFSEALKDVYFNEIGEIEHQCLHMTYEALSTALAKMGWATRNYVPVGSLLVGMAYLVRRIMENSSQVGVLTIMRSHKKGLTLLSPYETHLNRIKEGKVDRDLSSTKLDDEFFNITPVRIYLDEEREWIKKSLQEFSLNHLNKSYINSFIVSGEEVEIKSSSDLSISVGKIRFANSSDTDKAISVVDATFNDGEWANSSFALRAAILVKAAGIMLAKRNDLAALVVYEAGKSINEALADVDEAIDFLNFYARTETFLQKNYQDLTARGPVAVISPWNFPLAIPCGMVAASLVTGNTVILKSAEQTPLIAEVLTQLFYEAGIPEGILIHLPGIGESVGATLVNDPRISTIVFTGSKAVGMYIANVARKRVYHNKLTNKSYKVLAITEMGGKNAIIVTQNAELDETVSGILYSAFGHAGQKCSACSRVIVHHSLKDKLIDRLKEATMDMKVGRAFDFDTTINPIISTEDKIRLLNQAREASEEANRFNGKIIVDRSAEDLPGNCVGPVIIELPFERAFDKDSFASRELFGPVIHIVGFEKLDDAIKLYNSTEYALTGGIFSQSQNDIDYLLNKIESGNIYVNRTVTGARVAIEPFGGFKLSGTGPKAGGKHYLIALHQLYETASNYQSLPIDESSAYQFDLLKPSKLSEQSRLERMEKFLDLFISSFESFYQGITSEHKTVLKDFKKWISKNYLIFVTKEHKNRTIPGQISYNDFRINAEMALFVSVNPKPEIKTLVQVLTCLISGTGLTIACRNKDSYQFWMRIRDAFYSSGFSKENIDVFLSNNKNLKEVLNHPKLSVVIYDGSMHDYLINIASFLDDGKLDQRMKLFLTPADHLHSNDFYHQLMNYVWVRALAVNTMRHGAPLDLDI
jgi:RHH-type proline utilization regulon transcriptional repressor/proline dehydrogenase/delta 1-pyrroline-5-carboxylate dehydrogenase